MNGARYPTVGVIALTSNRWTDIWQPRHQVLSRLCRYFPVVWVNPAKPWRRVYAQPAEFKRVDPRPVPDLRIFSPDFSAPRVFRPRWLGERLERWRVERARSILTRAGCERIILYLWRPEFEIALDAIRADLSCYHIDDEYSFDTGDHPIPPAEERILRDVNQVFIHSPALLEKKGHINPNTSSVPNGVNYDAFATPVPEPEDLRDIDHPRIGYSGWIKKQLDWPLITALARRHGEWQFVLVGKRKEHPELGPACEKLERLTNVHFLGEKSVDELARYPQHFDVCIMPYVVDDYTRFIYPLKLHEYLASGRPVVGTPIRSLEAHRGVVTLAATDEAWSDALKLALEPEANSELRRQERQSVARAHDWSRLVHTVAVTMASHLDGAVADQIRREGPIADRTSEGRSC